MVRPAQDSNPAPNDETFGDDPAASFQLQVQQPASAANDNASAWLEFTLLENSHGDLTKRIEKGPDGKLIKTPSGNMSEGTATRIRFPLATWQAELIALLNGLKPAQAIAGGQLVPEGDSFPVVNEKRLAEAKANGPTTIARTKVFIAYAPDQPGAMLLDLDRDGMPAVAAEFIAAASGLLPTLEQAVLPPLADCGAVWRPSSSGAIVDAQTGAPYPPGGEHVYVVVVDGSDIVRALSVLLKRCWLAAPSLGWGKISESGQFLVRGAVDASVGLGNRIMFEAAPVLGRGLRQEPRSGHRPGVMLDTRALLPDLTPEEEARYEELLAAERERLLPEIKAKRAAYVAKHGKVLAERFKISVTEAENVVRHNVSQDSKVRELRAPWLLHSDRLGEVDLDMMLADPDKYHGEQLHDPIEPNYGGPGAGSKAIFYARDPQGRPSPIIRSFAHGETVYRPIKSAQAEFAEADFEELRQEIDGICLFYPATDLIARAEFRDLLGRAGWPNASSPTSDIEVEAIPPQRVVDTT